MAYAAVISLKQTIHRLVNSPHISIRSSSRDILEFAFRAVTSLQQVLDRLDNSGGGGGRLNALDEQIRDSVNKLEDVLDFHESNNFLSESDSHGDEQVRQEIISFSETVKKMEEDYIKELDNLVPEEEEDDAAVSSSSIDFGVKMVGLSDEFTKIKNQVLEIVRPYDFGVFALVGMAVTGRTILAKEIFEDVCIGKEQSVDCGAWVTVGPNYQFKEILLSVLAQIDPGNDKLHISEEAEKLSEYLYTRLKGRKYMIALDDVWDTQTWDYLRSSFPEQDNGSLVLLTTSLMEVAVYTNSFFVYEMPAFDENSIWDILCTAMFGRYSCPPELEEAGKKIAQNCRGRRLALAKLILFLVRADNIIEVWNNLAADEENPVFMDVADEISEASKIKEDLLQLCNSIPDDDERTSIIKLAIYTLGFYPLVEAIKKWLFPERFFPKMGFVSLFGMAGIGKTTLVKGIFEDPSILHHFDCRVWVTLGPKYQSEEIVVDILAQIYHDVDKMHMKRDAKLVKDLCAKLSGKRCLIVLDDIWNKEHLHYLQKLFPDIKGELLVTTRIADLAQFGDCVYQMQLLSKEESWCLLRQKVFAEEMCPHELERAGKRISENCEGLPLLILTVADL